MADQLTIFDDASAPDDVPAQMERSAVISPCGAYRYRLWRRWARGPRLAVWIMLNPSTADGEQDDPTIRRCVGFSRAHDCAALVVVNLFALRSTDPKALYGASAPVGPDNDDTIRSVVGGAALVIAAWGNHGVLQGRGDAVLQLLFDAGARPVCLGLTKLGQPVHPLYQPGNAPLLVVPDPRGTR